MTSDYQPRDNTGSLFVNEQKRSDKSPDRSGKAMIDGKMYYVDGWIKSPQSGEGQKFLSLSFKPVEGNERQSSNRGGRQQQRSDDF